MKAPCRPSAQFRPQPTLSGRPAPTIDKRQVGIRARSQPTLLRLLSFPLFDNTRIVGYSKESKWTRSEEHTSELQSLMRISYAVFCLKKKTQKSNTLYINKNK